jgi:pimeloyl-ACP methyl ester carboxylesterase
MRGTGNSSRRWPRRLGKTTLALAGAVAVVEIVAALRVRQLRAERAPLDGRLYAETRGQGDPIVFLAGLPGTTSYWLDSFDSLARDHRLIFLDALGFGRSPWPSGSSTLDDHLAYLRRTLEAERATERVTLVGHSYGTLLASYYAARHPEDVERLVLLGTPVFHGEEHARQRIRHMSATCGLFSLNPVFAREACKLHEAFSPLLAPLLPYLMKNVPAPIVRGGLQHTWNAYREALENVVLTKPVEIPLARLGSLGPGVTFVHGRQDGVTPLSEVHALASRIGAQVVETEDEHLSYSFREPGRIVAVIAASSSQ